MNWVTSLWSMVIAASLTMAAIYGFAWPLRQEAAVNLSFALLALVTAGFASVELWMMKAESPTEYALALRWFQVLVWLGVLAIAAFAHFYLRTGRVWLGLAACALRTLTLVPNFVGAANLNYLEVQRIEPLTFLGDQVAVPFGTRRIRGCSWAN